MNKRKAFLHLFQRKAKDFPTIFGLAPGPLPIHKLNIFQAPISFEVGGGSNTPLYVGGEGGATPPSKASHPLLQPLERNDISFSQSLARQKSSQSLRWLLLLLVCTKTFKGPHLVGEKKADIPPSPARTVLSVLQMNGAQRWPDT